MEKASAFLVAFIGISLSANAQTNSYRTLKFDMGVGLFPAVNITGELHARTSDEFALGIRAQAVVLRTWSSNDGYVSYSLTGDYYIPRRDKNKHSRIFVGGGVGSFSYNYGSNLNFDHSKLGIFPRVGLESGHFRLSAEYDVPDVSGENIPYVAINFGVFFGGGLKK